MVQALTREISPDVADSWKATDSSLEWWLNKPRSERLRHTMDPGG